MDSKEKSLDERLLFCSIDVVNSTAFKQSDQEANKNWPLFFRNFAESFPQTLNEQLISVTSECPKDYEMGDASFKLWKCLGDELILTISICRASQVWPCIEAFRKSIIRCRADYRKDKLKTLDFKGAAWFCSFPVYNYTICVNKSEDYIGPGMDIGFRIAKLATPRKLILSVEIPYIISCASHEKATKFYYDGQHDLKGVFRGNAYPIFWVRSDEEALPLAYKTESCKSDELKPYCEEYMDAARGILLKPFFEVPPLTTAPLNFAADLRLARQTLVDIVNPQDQDVADDARAETAGSDSQALQDAQRALDAFSSSMPDSAS